MSREIKFRAWDKRRKRYAKVIQTTNQGWKGYRDKTYITNGVMLFSKWVLSRFIIEQYTGLKDKNGDKEIYEYDIIDGEGNIIGNYHETPELLKDKTNLLIQGFGTKTWLTTYQEAVERGCHDA